MRKARIVCLDVRSSLRCVGSPPGLTAGRRFFAHPLFVAAIRTIAFGSLAISWGLLRDQSRATMPSTRNDPPPAEAVHRILATATFGRGLNQ